MILNILFIAVIAVIVIDLSGFVDTIKQQIWKFAYGKKPYKEYTLKPFDCSLCTTWWLSLIYIIATGNLTILNIMLCLLFAYTTPIIKAIIILIKDIVLMTLDKIYDIANNILK